MPTANAISAMPPDGRIAANIAIGIAKKAKPILGPRIKYREPSKWSSHHFICFDGEGYDINGSHEYVYKTFASTLIIIWVIAIGFIGYDAGGFFQIFFLVITVIGILLRIIQIRNQIKLNKYKNTIS